MSVDVERLRQLCDAASPGPWLVTRQYLAVETAQLDNRGEPYGHELWAVVANEDNDDADVRAEFERSAPFIAAARTALPACLDEIERLRAEVDKLHGTASRAMDSNAQLRAALTEACDLIDERCEDDFVTHRGVSKPTVIRERSIELRRLVQP